MRFPRMMTMVAGVVLATGAAAGDLDVRMGEGLRRGVDFLLGAQNANGSWGGPRRTKGLNIYAPLPGAHHAFRAGTTGLALSGLIEAGDGRPEVERAIARAGEWMASELPKLRRADQTSTYNSWGHAYGLRGLVRLYRREEDGEKRARWKALAQEQVDLANRYEDVNGGWGYLDLDDLKTKRPSGIPTPFTTATVLLAMREAEEVMGVELDGKTVEHAVAGIRALRSPDFAYGYSWQHRYRPRLGINRPAGSLSRSQACNACLRVFGDEAVSDEVIVRWADRFLDREGFLRNTRKRPIPHEGPFQLAGYFYYYGVFYFTESVSLLPAERRGPYAERIAELLLGLQEKDGSWWDYPLYDYHQPYGTGYALMALAWCREVLSEGR